MDYFFKKKNQRIIAGTVAIILVIAMVIALIYN